MTAYDFLEFEWKKFENYQHILVYSEDISFIIVWKEMLSFPLISNNLILYVGFRKNSV